MASDESWRLGKKSSCSRLAAKIHIKLFPICSRDACGTLQILSPLTRRGGTSPPLSTAFMSANELFSILVPHFFFCYFVRFQAETVNITITCDLAQPSVENNFHAHLFRPSHKQEVPKVAGSCITLNQLPLS